MGAIFQRLRELERDIEWLLDEVFRLRKRLEAAEQRLQQLGG